MHFIFNLHVQGKCNELESQASSASSQQSGKIDDLAKENKKLEGQVERDL